MADQELRFNIVGDDNLSGPLTKGGVAAEGLSRHMDAAARSAAILDEALRRQQTAARASVDATLALARADKILEDAEHGLRDGALEAEFALKRQAEAAKASGRAADEAAAKNRNLAESLRKAADSAKGSGPSALIGAGLLLTPAAATIGGVGLGAAAGLAGAFAAGAGAVAAFGAVAKPVLSDTLKAQAAVNTAQNNYAVAVAAGTKQATAYRAEQIAIGRAYAELSPQQIALSKQLGNMAQAWQDLKAAQTPVVAGALQPWLKDVTVLTGNLAPVIAKVSPVIQQLGTQFGWLLNLPQFTAFRDFIANTGSQAAGAIGGTLIDFVQAFITLLPKFNPLIEKTIGWIGGLGPAVDRWANSQKTADGITRFMTWFNQNGPVVGGLLKNVGAALKTLLPGLTAGGAAEVKVISGLFGWIAKLPPRLAAPIAETAGALLLLNKLGVISVGVKIITGAAGWISKLLGGATVDVGAAGMQKAGDTMLTAAGLMQKAAGTMAGAGAAEVTAGTEQGAAGAAEVTAGGLFAGASPAMAALGAALLAAVAYEGAKSAGNVLNYFKNPGGAAQALSPGGTPPGAFTSYVPPSVVAAANRQNAAAAASPQGQGINNLLAQGKAAQAYALALQGVTEILTQQPQRTKDALSAIDDYTRSIKNNGLASSATKEVAGLLAAAMESAGVKAGTANADVANYTKAIQQNGATSSQAAAARRQVVTDILSAGVNARQGQADLAKYTTAVQDNGARSRSAQADRARLIQDLINAGLGAQEATSLVNGLGTSLGKLPKNVNVNVTETGTGNFTITQGTSGHAGGTPTGGRPGAAAGMYVGIGTTPTADDVIIRASRGELVVPAHLVSAGAVDHLRGHIPGFASGGGIGALPGETASFHDRFVAAMTAAMEKSMTAAMKTAVAAATTAAVAGGGGPVSAGAAQAQAYAKGRLGAYGWGAGQMPYLTDLWNLESGWNRLARNPSSGAYGIPQAYPASKMGAAANPPTSSAGAQVDWGLGYIKSVYGTPQAADATEHRIHAYARGGLIRGFASGGPVGGSITSRVAGGSIADRGAAYLNAWRQSAGTINAQIDHWTHAEHIDAILAGAAGLSKPLHARYAKAEASDKKTLAGLMTERAVLRQWRTQLTGSGASLTAWIAAAGKTPALRANVAAWRKQLAGQKATIGKISAMLGLTGAELAADAAAAKAAAAASAAAAAAVAAASSAGGGAGGGAGAAAAGAAAAVPLSPGAALALLTGGTGAVTIPPLTGPGDGGGAFPWFPGSGGDGFPGSGGGWPGWPGWDGGQGQAAGVPGQRAGGGGLDAVGAKFDQLIAEIRNLTGVASAIPQRTGQHVGAAVNGAAAAGSFRARYP